MVDFKMMGENNDMIFAKFREKICEMHDSATRIHANSNAERQNKKHQDLQFTKLEQLASEKLLFG